MRLKSVLIGSVVSAMLIAVPFNFFGGVEAASSHTINIVGSALVPSSMELPISIPQGDSLIVNNNDSIVHTTQSRLQADTTVIEWPLQSYDAKVTGQSADSHSHKFNTAGVFELLLDGTVKTTVTVTATTPTPTPSVVPSATVTSTPSTTVTPTPTAIATASPTATPAPTVDPTQSPTPVPTASITPSPTPTLEPTVTPSPTVVPTVVPTSTPTPTPTVTASPTIIPTPTVFPTATPTATPVVTATPSTSPAPTVLPVPSVLPSFSIFRPVSCSAQLVSNNSQVVTDKLSSIYLVRGYWNITSLTPGFSSVSANVHLFAIQKINLLFRGNWFFGGNQVVSANETANFVGSDTTNLLQKASISWCAR